MAATKAEVVDGAQEDPRGGREGDLGAVGRRRQHQRQLRAEGSRGLHSGTPSFPPGGPHGHYVLGDDVDVHRLQNDGGWHQLLAIASASMASAARRYSLASQSFARW